MGAGRPHGHARDPVTAFGSCFAADISDWLAARRYDVLTRHEGSGA